MDMGLRSPSHSIYATFVVIQFRYGLKRLTDIENRDIVHLHRDDSEIICIFAIPGQAEKGKGVLSVIEDSGVFEVSKGGKMVR